MIPTIAVGHLSQRLSADAFSPPLNYCAKILHKNCTFIAFLQHSLPGKCNFKVSKGKTGPVLMYGPTTLFDHGFRSNFQQFMSDIVKRSE